jgi:hypothetical protein
MRAVVVVGLVTVMAATSVVAAPIPPVPGDAAGHDGDPAAIARALESRLVAAHLRALGLSSGAIQAHLARLDAGELHRMAQSLQDVEVGGQGDLSTEQKFGVALLLILAVAAVAGLVYLSVSGSGF